MKTLFYSSLAMVIGSAYCLVFSKTPIKLIWTSGLVTSLLNHSLSDKNSFKKELFRCLDRNAMRCGFVIYHLYRVKYLYFLDVSAAFYIVSKITNLTEFHVVSHFFVVVFHHKMLLS